MDTKTTDKQKIYRLPPAERLRHATRIMTGLLASGHYTEMETLSGAEEEPAEPRVRRFDAGKDWKETGLKRRHLAHAVGDAVSLLKELEAEFAEEMVQSVPNPVPVRLTPKKRRS